VDGGRPGLELCGATGRRDGARCEGRAAARVWRKAAATVGRRRRLGLEEHRLPEEAGNR
jgi:hypothetical protein